MTLSKSTYIKIPLFIIGILIYIVLCFLIPIYLPGFRGDIDSSDICDHNKPIGTISKGKLFIQECVAQKNYLVGVEIMLATWNRKNTNQNQMAILDQNYNILIDQQFSSIDIKDNYNYSFNFPKDIFIGKDNPFFICLYSDDGNENNSITAWADTLSNVGNLYLTELNDHNITKAAYSKKIMLKGSLIFKLHESTNNKYLLRVLFLILVSLVISGVYLALKKSSIAVDGFKKSEIIISLIFIIWIIVPGLYFYILKNKELLTSKREQRSLSRKPELQLYTLEVFPKNYQNYFNDHFPARDMIVFLRSITEYQIFNSSLFPSKITLGKDGWFFRPGERKVLEDPKWLSADAIDSIINVLNNYSAYYKRKGIAFYIALVPLKSDIYREHLPDYYRLTNQRLTTDILIEALLADSSLNIINLKNKLSQTKSEGNVFFKTDFHWSEIGAYKAYYEIMNRVHQDFPMVIPIEPSDFYLTPSTVKSGNDVVELGLEDYITEPFYNFILHNPKSIEAPKAGYNAPAGFSLTDHFEFVRTNPDTTLPRIVVIRDSFFHLLVPLVGESFSKSVFIWDGWQYGLNEEIIELEKPDIVLMEAYVNFLPNLLKTNKKDHKTSVPD
ncbi:MAG: hypothetical protein HQ521_05290 [Bacteroidetes bacterium]|nr:hypothetical protein [Bacteroidota bacterium]